MHSKFVALTLVGCALCMGASSYADEDPLALYKVTQVTETVDLKEDGTIKAMSVIRESKIDFKERIAEVFTTDAKGKLRLSSRTTVTQDAKAGSVTVVEESLPDHADLVTTSVTTVTKAPSGESLTTVETLNEFGELEFTSRTFVKHETDKVITTVEKVDKDGNLFLCQTVTKQ